jgi:hypothetical protein
MTSDNAALQLNFDMNWKKTGERTVGGGGRGEVAVSSPETEKPNEPRCSIA